HIPRYPGGVRQSPAGRRWWRGRRWSPRSGRIVRSRIRYREEPVREREIEPGRRWRWSAAATDRRNAAEAGSVGQAAAGAGGSAEEGPAADLAAAVAAGDAATRGGAVAAADGADAAQRAAGPVESRPAAART